MGGEKSQRQTAVAASGGGLSALPHEGSKLSNSRFAVAVIRSFVERAVAGATSNGLFVSKAVSFR